MWFVPNSGACEKLGFKASFNDEEKPGAAKGPSPLPSCTVSLRLHRTNAELAVMKVILPGLRSAYRFPATNTWENTFVLDKDSFAVAHNDLARLVQTEGRLDESARHYLAALQLDSSLAEAHNNLGILYLQQGRLAGGATQLREALRPQLLVLPRGVGWLDWMCRVPFRRCAFFRNCRKRCGLLAGRS